MVSLDVNALPKLPGYSFVDPRVRARGATLGVRARLRASAARSPVPRD
jgi:hypothetical protein